MPDLEVIVCADVGTLLCVILPLFCAVAFASGVTRKNANNAKDARS